MARIPMGDFGQRLPEARRTSVASAGQLDGGLADATQRLGNTAMNIGGQMIAEQQREAEKAAAEAKQEQERQAARAERVSQLTAHAGIQTGLADLHDEIAAGVNGGTLSQDDARKQWTERSTKVVGDQVAKLPPDLGSLVTAEMAGLSGRLKNSLEDTFRKRNQSDADAGLMTYREQMQRFASSDMATATKQWEKVARESGAQAGWNPEKIAKEVQSFRETVSYTRGYELVSGARNDRKGLDAAEKAIGNLPDLDPQKRAALLDRVSGYKFALDQKAELAAQRAQRQQEAQLKRAEAAFQTFQGVVDKGLAMDPAYVDAVVQQTAGTPYQAGIRALAQQSVSTGGLAAQPIAVQRRELDSITAQIAREGNNPALQKRREQVEKALRGSESDSHADPMRAYLQRSPDAAEFQPLDVTSLQGLAQSLNARLPFAERASVWSGGPVAPLTAEEIEPVRKMLGELPPAMLAPTIATLSTTLGPSGSAGLAQQLNKTDRALGLAFAQGASQTTEGRNVSALILRGAKAERDGTSTKNKEAADVKPGQWKRFLTTELEGVFHNQQTTDDIRDSAFYISHGISAEQGGRLTEDDMRRAVRLAVGGPVVDHNGRKIPLPAGVDEDMLSKRLRSVDSAEITQQAGGATVRAAGVDIPVTEFLKSLPGQQLAPVRPGQFAVIVNGRPVTGARNEPIIIRVR